MSGDLAKGDLAGDFAKGGLAGEAKGKGKKGKGGGKPVAHRDIYARLSYLYQTAQHLSQQSDLEPLGRMYAHNMKAIAKKSVLRVYVFLGLFSGCLRFG